MTEFPKKYKAKDIEQKWQNFWYENDVYKYDASLSRDETYVIDTPPPTVSGMLHMGHVFSYTQADFIARYQRMKGKTVYYPMGFDDNGLPTERLVEKIKKVKGVHLDRSEFVALCKDVVVAAEEDFRDLFKSIALSVDWHEEYQTISDRTRLISQLSFLDLHEKGLLEHKSAPCYFDCVDQTALSQADLEDKDMASTMNDIIFRSVKDNKEVVIATTRPELIPACVAIFVHPEDKRYQDLVGEEVETALFKVRVPVIADSLVEMEKGTGVVMCCTFGDITDIAWWKSHKLKTRVLINKRGLLADIFNEESKDYDSDLLEDLKAHCDITNYQEAYQLLVNQKVEAARKAIIEKLQEAGLLVKQDHITHPVKCAERSGKPIEILVTKQWFIKVLEHKEELLKKSSEVNWYPPHMQIRMDQWIENLSWDWCISRQRFFGVPFPVWYITEHNAGSSAKTEKVVATPDQLPLDPLYAVPKGYSRVSEEVNDDGSFLATKDGKEYLIKPECDVMDTWATSSVTPQISSRAISDKYYDDIARHQKLFPADLRPQAHEIIRSWAFYTMVKAYHHEGTLPWHNVMISGWCLASDKTKMSKSKGNVVTPVGLIEDKGSDVVRYWASTSHLGSDTAYSEVVLAVGKKLVTKLWNAAKFASLNLDKLTEEVTTIADAVSSGKVYCVSDLWILSRLQQTIVKAEAEFERYEYAKARDAVDSFFWNDFCDNYLEIAKTRSYASKEKMEVFDDALTDAEIDRMQQSALITLSHVLEGILKLFAPFVPHITEELYNIIFADKKGKLASLHQRGSWPNIAEYIVSKESLEIGNFILSVIDQVRKNKSDNNFALNKEIESLEITSLTTSLPSDVKFDLKSVNNAKSLTLTESSDDEITITPTY